MNLPLKSMLVATSLLVGCLHEDDVNDMLFKRAGFDFQCDAKSLTYQKIDDMTVGMSGCGHRATYILVCAGHEPCRWVMNSTS